jgi:hypothetical protein
MQSTIQSFQKELFFFKNSFKNFIHTSLLRVSYSQSMFWDSRVIKFLTIFFRSISERFLD